MNVEGVPEVFGGSLPAGIWHDFMAGAVGGLPIRGFPQPSFAPYNRYPSQVQTSSPSRTG